MARNIADGQLAATSGTLVGVAGVYPKRNYVSVRLFNTSSSLTETTVLTVSVASGTARTISRVDLAPYETLQVDNIPLDDADILAGYTTTASTVDYVVSESSGGPFDIRAMDIYGAMKHTGTTGSQSFTGATTVTSTSASALAVGANGATNPVLKVNANTASVATGLTIVGAAAAGGVAATVISSGTNENLTIDAKGSGTITLNATGTGNIVMGRDLTTTKGILSTGPTGSGIGYATGAGGAVTQTTNRSTGVTLNKLAGAITTDTTSLAAGAEAAFTVTNSTVAATDTVVVSLKSGSTGVGTCVPYVSAVAAGSFDITISNQHASTAETGACVINFAVIKSVAS